MPRTEAENAPWMSQYELRRHFRKHSAKLKRNSVEEYDESARATIRAGVRFNFTSSEGKRRVGYYHRPSQRLTVLDEDEAFIVSHFACDEAYLRRQTGSGYKR